MSGITARKWLTAKLITWTAATVTLIAILCSASASTSDSLKAVQDLEPKFRQNPKQWSSEMTSAVFRLATDYFRANRFADAKATYIRANLINIKDTGRPSSIALVGAGDCCLKLKQYPEAEKYLNQALTLLKDLKNAQESPGEVNVRLGLAEVYENTDRKEKAEQSYQAVAEDVLRQEASLVQAISSPRAFDAYAQFLERQGNTKGAELWYQRVATLRTNAHAFGLQSDCLRHYAALLRKQKRDKEAVAMERRANELSATQSRMNKSGLDY